MRNEKITFPQFLSMSFLCTMSFPLFIKDVPSVYLVISVLLALAVNLFVFLIYRGQAQTFFIPLCGIYLSFYCALIIAKFADYMYKALSYKPEWLIIFILAAFAFFCTVKGIEALARASAVISFFALLGIIYMFACTFSGIEFTVTADLPTEGITPLILLLPTVLYVVNYDNILNIKKSSYFIGSGIMTAVYLYFMFIAVNVHSAYPIQYLPTNSHIGVFKGSDCILLAILTISAIYSVAVSATGLFKYFKHKYITNSVYISVLIAVSITLSYLSIKEFDINVIFTALTLIVIFTIILISAFYRKYMYKNS